MEELLRLEGVYKSFDTKVNLLARLQGEGLIAPGAAGSLVPTQRGWLMGNEVFGAIWGLA